MSEAAHYDKVGLYSPSIVNKNVAHTSAASLCELEPRLDIPSAKKPTNMRTRIDGPKLLVVCDRNYEDFPCLD
jgi:hypothetical protein